MESIHAKTLATINKLIDVCKDSEHGYKTCVEIITDENHKKLFEKISRQRENFINQLQHETTKYAEDDEPKENLSKSFEGWKKLQPVIEHPDAKVIFEICEEAEDEIKYIFGDAVKQDIPGVTKSLITEQYNKIRDSHDEIKLARDGLRKS